MRGFVMSRCLPLLLVTGLVVAGAGCNDNNTPTGLTGNGQILINTQPNTIAFPWHLIGAGGTDIAAGGDTLLTDMTPGDYTIQWLAQAGWRAPAETLQSRRLGTGAVLTFAATYRSTSGQVTAGQVIIDVRPDTLAAGWTLTGPGGFTSSGIGDATYEDMTAGTYTVVWDDVDGFDTPLADSKDLNEGAGVIFTGTYTPQSVSQLHFVTVLAGEFQMGSTPTPSVTSDNEYPKHLVRLTHSFEMSETEVTWAQFERYMGYNPSQYGEQCTNCPSHPVETVSWLEAAQFCNALSASEGLTPAYTISGDDVTWDSAADGYRLPTEAEWEYACRAGTVTSYADGQIELGSSSCYLEPHLDLMGWYCHNAMQHPQQVATLLPNDWGLYDMHGNVWEWVWDWSSPHYDRVTMTVERLQHLDGTPYDQGLVVARNALPYAGAQNALGVQGRDIDLQTSDLGLTLSDVTVAVADFGQLVNLQVNGADIYRGALLDAPADIAPGVTLQVALSDVNDPQLGAGHAGTLTFTGDVQQLLLGGESIWLDDIELVDADTGPFGRDRTIDFEMSPLGNIYPTGSSTELPCTVTDPIGPLPSSGTPHMLRGGSFISNPRECRSATRSSPTPDKTGPYAGFRIVRTLD